MVDDLSATYLHKNPIIRAFSRTKINLILKIADLKKEDIILDFGCGKGWLKNKLKEKGHSVIGYDITPENSDIKDYTKIKPNKIFLTDVFEHLSKEEIEKVIGNFKKMNPNFELITSIPTENWISRKARKILGKREKAIDHITPLKEILEILKKNLKLVKKIDFLTVSYIAKFINI